MKQYFPLLLTLAILFMAPQPALADDPLPASTAFFQQGLALYADGDYRQALDQFLAARDLGASGASLLYNIGVCHYRLGNYPAAKVAFAEMADNPKMASLAFYNLGLVALKLDEPDEARRWFNRSLSSGPPQKLRLLALHALTELDRTAPQRRQWLRYGSLCLGHDDNVTLTPEGDTLEPSGRADGFNEIIALLHGSIGEDSLTGGWQLQLGGLYRRHFSLADFDTGSAHLGLFYRTKLDSMTLQGGLRYTYATLAEQSFEQLTSADLQATYPLGQASSLRLTWQSGYLDILEPAYEGLRGWRHRGGVQVNLKREGLRTRLAYNAEMNDRDGEVYSPTRHSLRASVERELARRVTMLGSGSFRTSRYGETGNAERRRDEQLQCSAKLTWHLADRWALEGGYEYTRNNSNLNHHDYSRNQITLALSHHF